MSIELSGMRSFDGLRGFRNIKCDNVEGGG